MSRTAVHITHLTVALSWESLSVGLLHLLPTRSQPQAPLCRRSTISQQVPAHEASAVPPPPPSLGAHQTPCERPFFPMPVPHSPSNPLDHLRDFHSPLKDPFNCHHFPFIHPFNKSLLSSSLLKDTTCYRENNSEKKTRYLPSKSTLNKQRNK